MPCKPRTQQDYNLRNAGLQEDMLQKRRDEFDNSIVTLTSWDGFVKALDEKKMVMTPW